MREIKFRAWDKKKNRLIMPGEICRLHFDEGLCYCILLWTDEMILDFELIDYTGLKDKNGKEIYGRDIGRTNRGNVGTVSYSDSVGWHIQYKLENNPNINRQCPYDEDTKIQGLWELCFGKRFEVIGNIYENPELLEGT